MKRYNLRAVVNDVVLEVSSYYNNFKYRDQSVIRSMLLKKAIESQKFNSDVAAKLGPELNAARFVFHVGGKLQFKDQNVWIDTMKPIVDTEKQADLFVSQVDLSDTNVYYEGLLNFKGTSQLRSLNLSQTPTMDDWCCDRLAYIFENSQLIDLDLSNCESITERGVAALGRIRSLKKVNIANTSASRSQNIELVILLFNEIRPDTHFQLE